MLFQTDIKRTEYFQNYKTMIRTSKLQKQKENTKQMQLKKIKDWIKYTRNMSNEQNDIS